MKNGCFVLLIVFTSSPLLFADCQGCCSSHGGVVCVGGVTRCGDGTSLTQTCRDKGCSACSTTEVPDVPEVIPPPRFINNSHFIRNAVGDLICLLPNPNSDGMLESDEGYGYVISIRNGCFYIPGLANMRVDSLDWPREVEIPGDSLPDDYVIIIARRKQGLSNSSEVLITGPAGDPQRSDSLATSHARWFFHLPKVSGGFKGTLKAVNGNPSSSNTITLNAFDADGDHRVTDSLTLEPGETAYFSLYGNETNSLFSGWLDQLSHLSISDDKGWTKFYLEYTSIESEYGSWTEEVDLSQEAGSDRFEMEARSGRASSDGVAVLNLSSSQSVRIWVRHFDRTGDLMGSRSLGRLAPGAKTLAVLSDLFPYQEDAKYTIEAQDSGHPIQVFGISIFEDKFFGLVPVQKM